MSAAVQKICVVCGKDVAGLKRVKDQAGQYYCAPCHDKLVANDRRPGPMAPPTETPYGPVDLADLNRELDLVPPPPASTRTIPQRANPSHSGAMASATPRPTSSGHTCPCCNKQLDPKAKICVDCGIKVPSGRPMITALGRNEDQLYGNAEAIIRPLSWIIWFGLYPIASEAYGTKKPYATWAIAIITTLCSLAFFVSLMGDGDHEQAMQLMLWPPGHAMTDAEILSLYQSHHDDRIGIFLRKAAADVDLPNATEDQRIVAAFRALGADEPRGDFRWYQLFTNVLLHDPSSIFALIMHLGGNMLFLLIFGTRVNALIGNLKFAILYPLLGAAASGAQLLFGSGRGPALGASGAIMGLAGMYLIFFPVHRVYMAFWLKIVFWYLWRIPAWIIIWPLRGFWVLAFYLSFDVISTLLRARDGVAHWAHLGGFAAGVLIAAVLLISRLQDANHGDLFAVLLGRWSWPLIGKPRRAGLNVALARF